MKNCGEGTHVLCTHTHTHTYTHVYTWPMLWAEPLPAYLVSLNVPSGETEFCTRVSNLAFGAWA